MDRHGATTAMRRNVGDKHISGEGNDISSPDEGVKEPGRRPTVATLLQKTRVAVAQTQYNRNPCLSIPGAGPGDGNVNDGHIKSKHVEKTSDKRKHIPMK